MNQPDFYIPPLEQGGALYHLSHLLYFLATVTSQLNELINWYLEISRFILILLVALAISFLLDLAVSRIMLMEYLG